MTNISILKIEAESGTLLVSDDATQEILPATKYEICRNIDFEPIPNTQPIKLKCLIKTKDIPDMSILRLGALFKIYSIVKLKQSTADKLPDNYILDSCEFFEDHVIYRPIFNMLLTNFTCCDDNIGNTTWKIEFEEQ
jgi:hypothetical protein